MPLVKANFDFGSHLVEAKDADSGDNVPDSIEPDKMLQFVDYFSAEYKKYASGAIVLGCQLDHDLGESTMKGVLSGAGSNTVADITILATAIAQYWAVQITPGIPSHGGIAVVSAANDASSKISALTAAITAIITTTDTTGNDQSKMYHNLLDASEAVVSTIIWTIIETVIVSTVPTPIPFPEVIG